jgi:putative hydrolase of the HAD superfamily
LAAKLLGPGVRAVFFDAVGTLIHPQPSAGDVYCAVGRRFGSRLSPAAVRDRFTAAFQTEERIDQAAGLRTSEEREFQRWQRIVATVLDDVHDPEGCFDALFEHFARPEAWAVDADAAVVLPPLARAGLTLGLASNYDRRLRSVIAGLPTLAPVCHLVISSEVGWRKPAPEFFDALCRQVELRPVEVVLVGDDVENDYEGASAAGLRAVLFDPHGRSRDRATLRIDRLSDIC